MLDYEIKLNMQKNQQSLACQLNRNVISTALSQIHGVAHYEAETQIPMILHFYFDALLQLIRNIREFV